MADTSTLKRRATIAGQDRDVAVRQRQAADDRLSALVEQIAKAKPDERSKLIAEYAVAGDTVSALTAAVELLSHWADDATVAVAEAEVDIASEAASKAAEASREHREQMNAHRDEMRQLHNRSHPAQAELEGKELDEWQVSMKTKEAEIKERGQQVQRDHNRASLAEQRAEAALEELKASLS